MKAASRQRWALSFADLSLLLLGFFVLLQARPDPVHLASGMRQAFGAERSAVLEGRASRWFQPGEAILTPSARDHLIAFAMDAKGGKVVVASRGTEPATRRFDGWELAAARTAAVARTLQGAGLAENRISLAIDPSTGGGQSISVGVN